MRLRGAVFLMENAIKPVLSMISTLFSIKKAPQIPEVLKNNQFNLMDEKSKAKLFNIALGTASLKV